MRFNEKMTEEEYNASRERHGALWWAGRILVLIMVIGTFAILVWRLVSAIVPDSMKTVTPTPALCEAWQAAEAEGRELYAYANELDSITRAEHNYAYFSVSNVIFIEEIQQVQFSFRYNNSTIMHLVEDYQLEKVPDRAETLYDVTLYVAYDLTPEDTSDNAGNDPGSVEFVRYFPSSCYADATTMYNYRRFVFDGLETEHDGHPMLAVYVDVYYTQDIDYEKESYGTLIIYDYLAEKVPHSWSKKDKAALAGGSAG